MATSVCRQCGSTRTASGGRCKGCGVVVDPAAAARRQRLAERAERHFGDPFGWLEAVPALVIVPLVLAGVLPRWALVIALVLSFRTVWRLLVRLADAWTS